LQLSLKAASPETFRYTLVKSVGKIQNFFIRCKGQSFSSIYGTEQKIKNGGVRMLLSFVTVMQPEAQGAVHFL
jgi:hypothetical protein